MAVWHSRSNRKKTGGLYHRARKHKKYEKGSNPTFTLLDSDVKIRKDRVRGGNCKLRALRIDYAIVNLKDGTSKRVKILDVLENKANMHFVRKKVITKGAIIQTEIGKAKVTSRPGQEGIVNAVLIE